MVTLPHKHSLADSSGGFPKRDVVHRGASQLIAGPSRRLRLAWASAGDRCLLHGEPHRALTEAGQPRPGDPVRCHPPWVPTATRRGPGSSASCPQPDGQPVRGTEVSSPHGLAWPCGRKALGQVAFSVTSARLCAQGGPGTKTTQKASPSETPGVWCRKTAAPAPPPALSPVHSRSVEMALPSVHGVRDQGARAEHPWGLRYTHTANLRFLIVLTAKNRTLLL